MTTREAPYIVAAAALVAMIALAATPAAPPVAPDFTLTQCLNADTLRLAGFDREPVLVVFYDGGDMVSLNALPYVNEWNRRYKGDGLKVIGIHSPALEPLKTRYNAVEAASRAKVEFPVGMDFDRAVYKTYALTDLPAYILLKPGREVVYETAKPRPYVAVETAIQKLLTERKPGIVHPFIVKPLRPIDDPAKKLLLPTGKLTLGYEAGAIAGCDSAARDTLHSFTDSREREKGRVYLQGNWEVTAQSVVHQEKYGSGDDHLRVVYSGKDVWLLLSFEFGTPHRVYIKQDRNDLPKDDWGSDVEGDLLGKPYVFTQYSIPVHIVSNHVYGTHELELIPGEGDFAFYYLFFEGDVAE